MRATLEFDLPIEEDDFVLASRGRVAFIAAAAADEIAKRALKDADASDPEAALASYESALRRIRQELGQAVRIAHNED